MCMFVHALQTSAHEAHQAVVIDRQLPTPTCQALCHPTGRGSGGLPLHLVSWPSVLFRDQSETDSGTFERLGLYPGGMGGSKLVLCTDIALQFSLFRVESTEAFSTASLP